MFNEQNGTLTNCLLQSQKLINLNYVNDTSNIDKICLMSKIKSKIQAEAPLYPGTLTINDWNQLKTFLLSAYGDKRDDSTIVYELTLSSQTI